MSRKSKPGRERLVATLDHKVALVKGGRNSRDNVVAACLGCNQDKSDMTVEQFAEWRASRAASLRALAEMGE
jgi:5-methylcytosine-specific restriction endonuclease McrA